VANGYLDAYLPSGDYVETGRFIDGEGWTLAGEFSTVQCRLERFRTAEPRSDLL
jgi:hypothetical protein